jgi:nitroreductase
VSIVDIFEAVESRFSCRAFLNKPVDPTIVRDLIERAGRSASNGNLQPWRVHALTGTSLDQLKREAATAVVDQNPHENVTEFPVYPSELEEPYKSRREQMGATLYGALNVARTDQVGRLKFYRQNFEFFGAPVGLIFCIERQLGPPQWADLGSYISTLMYLARGCGLDTCAQVAWARVCDVVGKFLNLPPEQMVYCGMAIGYGDHSQPANRIRMPRAALEEYCKFHGFG